MGDKGLTILRKALFADSYTKNAEMLTLQVLKKKGVTWIFVFFSFSVLLDPKQKLVSEIRQTVLLNQPAVGFIWTLLKLVYEADCCAGKKMPLLSMYFEVDELQMAKENMKMLVTVNVQSEQVANEDVDCSQSFELEVVG